MFSTQTPTPNPASKVFFPPNSMAGRLHVPSRHSPSFPLVRLEMSDLRQRGPDWVEIGSVFDLYKNIDTNAIYLFLKGTATQGV